MHALTNSELVTRILAGERSAEDELVQRYARGVSAILRHVTGDPSLTEDLSQETFSVVIQKLRGGELRDPERLAGFISSLARNLAIAYYRRIRRESSEQLDETNPATHASPTQLDLVIVKEQELLVRQVLAELGSDRDRQILYRFYIREDEKELICADLQIDALHFNRVIHRARQRYRDLYVRRKPERN